MLTVIDGRRVYYDLLGSRDWPVVCLMHSLSSDSGVWSEQVPALLVNGWRVLRVDMRGHGGSEGSPGAYTMSELARDLATLLDFLGIAAVHLVGLSIGGMIAQTFAVAHGSRVVSLMLCGTAPCSLEGGDQLWNPRFRAIGASGSVEPLADATMERWFTDAFRSERPDRLKQIRATVAATSTDGYIGGGKAINSFDIRHALRSLRLPTLVVCGDEDSGTPPAGNRLIASLIPDARYVEMQSARHIPMIQYPDAFNRILLGWLESRRA